MTLDAEEELKNYSTQHLCSITGYYKAKTYKWKNLSEGSREDRYV